MNLNQWIDDLFEDDSSRYEEARKQLLSAGHEALRPLLASLHSPQPRHRERVVELLGRLEHLDATPALTDRVVADPNARVRIAAAKALLQIEDVTVLGALGAALDDPEPAVRIAAVRALAGYNIRQALEALRPLTSDPDDEVSSRAAIVVGLHLQDPAAALRLLNDFDDSSSELIVETLQVFAALPDERAATRLLNLVSHPVAEVRLATVPALGRVGGSMVVEILVDLLLHDEVAEVRAAAARTLGKLDNLDAVRALHEALTDVDQQVIAEAAEALGYLRSDSSLVPLLGVLERDVLPQTRKQVVRAIGHLGNEAATSALRLILYEDLDYTVQYNTALALADLANPAALAILRDALGHTSYLIRQAAAKALGEVRDPAAAANLDEALQDPDRGVRHLAALALLKINRDFVEKALTLLLEDLYHADYEVCWYTLRSIQGDPDRRFVNPLLAVLDDPDGSTRALAAEVLGDIGDPRASKGLVPLLRDPVWEVRRAARLALIKLGYSFADII